MFKVTKQICIFEMQVIEHVNNNFKLIQNEQKFI